MKKIFEISWDCNLTDLKDYHIKMFVGDQLPNTKVTVRELLQQSPTEYCECGDKHSFWQQHPNGNRTCMRCWKFIKPKLLNPKPQLPEKINLGDFVKITSKGNQDIRTCVTELVKKFDKLRDYLKEQSDE